MLFAPIHWSAENSSAGRIGALVHPITDAVSGQPEAKATPAGITPFAVSHFGFALSRHALRPAGLAYWAAARTSFGHMLNFALDTPAEGWRAWLAAALPNAERVSLEDAGAGVYRAAQWSNGRLECVLFIGPNPKLPSPEWLKSQFDTSGAAIHRRALLSGRPVEPAADEGPIVCVCFQVGAARIAAAAADGNRTVEKIGARLGAGTNCGSCIPEIRRLIMHREMADAAS
jgi:assimilatory nitrate reductase catalytic subunit